MQLKNMNKKLMMLQIRKDNIRNSKTYNDMNVARENDMHVKKIMMARINTQLISLMEKKLIIHFLNGHESRNLKLRCCTDEINLHGNCGH